MDTTPRSNVWTVATLEKQLVAPALALGAETELVVDSPEDDDEEEEVPDDDEEEEEVLVEGLEATGVPVTGCP